MMTKKSGGAALTAFTVTVTPTAPPVGSEVECDIAAAGYETDNALFLPSGSAYDITFQLMASPHGGYTFHTPRPFCNRRKHCPKPLPNGSVTNPYTVTDDGSGNGGASITVHVAQVHGRAVTHYRLNFHGGYSFDPIIIHE